MPLKTRECGECNACCFRTIVTDDLGKRISEDKEWCRHCTVGVGCSIYNIRPVACRGYSCLWRDGGLPEWARPDQCGIILDFVKIPTHDFTLFTMREFKPGSLQRTDVKGIKSAILSNRKNVLEIRPLSGVDHLEKPESLSVEEAVGFLEVVHIYLTQRATELGLDLGE
jgi:hypothetical protein